MSFLPMKKCKTCDNIFKSPRVGTKITCPRCGSKGISDASKLDLDFFKKNGGKV